MVLAIGESSTTSSKLHCSMVGEFISMLETKCHSYSSSEWLPRFCWNNHPQETPGVKGQRQRSPLKFGASDNTIKCGTKSTPLSAVQKEHDMWLWNLRHSNTCGMLHITSFVFWIDETLGLTHAQCMNFLDVAIFQEVNIYSKLKLYDIYNCLIWFLTFQ